MSTVRNSFISKVNNGLWCESVVDIEHDDPGVNGHMGEEAFVHIRGATIGPPTNAASSMGVHNCWPALLSSKRLHNNIGTVQEPLIQLQNTTNPVLLLCDYQGTPPYQLEEIQANCMAQVANMRS